MTHTASWYADKAFGSLTAAKHVLGLVNSSMSKGPRNLQITGEGRQGEKTIPENWVNCHMASSRGEGYREDCKNS